MKKTSFKRYFVKVPRTPPFNLPFPAQPFFSATHPNRPFLLPIFFISSASLTFPDRLFPSYVFPLKFLSLFFFSSPSFLPLTHPFSTLAVHMFLLSPPSSLFPYNSFSSVIPSTFPLIYRRSKSNLRKTNIRIITSVRPQATNPLSLYGIS